MCIGWFLSPKPTIQWWKDGFSICHDCWDTALCLFWGHAPIITTISGLRGNGWNLAIIFFFSCQVWNRNNRPARFRDFSILYNVDRPTHLSPLLHQNFRNGLRNWCVKHRAWKAKEQYAQHYSCINRVKNIYSLHAFRTSIIRTDFTKYCINQT